MTSAPSDSIAAQLGETLHRYLDGRPADMAPGRTDPNEAAFERFRLLPRVLRGCAGIDIRAELFGRTIAGPLAVGAFAADRVFHAEGLLPVASVCQRLGLPLVVSEETVTPLAELAAAHDACWLQLRAAGPVDRARTMLDVAARAGAQGIVLTVLAPARARPGLHPGGFDIGTELVRRGWPTIGGTEPGVAPLAAFPHWSWKDVRAVADHARSDGLPVMLKGVLREEDARLARMAGCEGIIASNIGLRQLGRWALPLDRLPALRAAADGVLMLDGGVRHGVDAVVACCLGADIAIATRPVVRALVAGGEAGVETMLQGWLDEIANVASWLGVERLDELDGSFITTGPE